MSTFKTAEAMHQKLSHGWCGDPARGAGMGWSFTPKQVDETPVKCRLFRVPLVNGYDPAGDYYGLPSDLWECQPEDLPDAPPYDVRAANRGEVEREPFRFRAADRAAAIKEVKQYYPNARFFRGATKETKEAVFGVYGQELFERLEEVDERIRHLRSGQDRWWRAVSWLPNPVDGLSVRLTDASAAELDVLAIVVNQGIDVHLEAITGTFTQEGCHLDATSVHVLLRRLTELKWQAEPRKGESNHEITRTYKALRTRIHRALAGLE